MGLRFKVKVDHFRNAGYLKLRCTAMIGAISRKSSEVSAQCMSITNAECPLQLYSNPNNIISQNQSHALIRESKFISTINSGSYE